MFCVGGFWTGSKNEPTTRPDGLVLESVKNGLPIIQVAINYRLGCKSDAVLPPTFDIDEGTYADRAQSSVSPNPMPSDPKAQRTPDCATNALQSNGFATISSISVVTQSESPSSGTHLVVWRI